ncbi:alpha/beta hydrolase [Ferrovibrio sp.]|uniref:alpha/beta hydrolase n=1 Tax=Ferrovibrio sp. TaxID=1917215 RepID=UPI003D2DC819
MTLPAADPAPFSRAPVFVRANKRHALASLAPALAVALLSLSGCATDPGAPSIAIRQQTADAIAAQAAGGAALQPRRIEGRLPLNAYLRQRDPTQPLTIYIEGDGLAFIDNKPTSNPTPVNPIGLRLAGADPSANVAWLARPCQYAGISAWDCGINFLWTTGRHAEQAVAATMRGIDALVLPGQQIHLVGFSGGAANAALAAARRNDVLSLRTVAGTLDTVALTTHFGEAPMTGSLNPAEIAARLARLPQRHYVGGHDPIVPRFAADNFLGHQSIPPGCQRLEIIPDATHVQGWVERWPQLLQQPLC